ncbi:MAG: DUF2085 domain-containing protein [Candidatus Bilamarchaeaceae archaeon]
MMVKPYHVFLLLLLAFTLPIFLSPFLLHENQSAFSLVQLVYSPTCHQLTARSLCYFPATGSISDCKPEVKGDSDRSAVVLASDGLYGYKFPVCTRDVAIYLFLLIGTLAYPFLKRIDNDEIPDPLLLIVALIPIAFDGGTQLIGLRESSNMLRLFTGAIAGFALPFYIIPMLNRVFGKKK